MGARPCRLLCVATPLGVLCVVMLLVMLAAGSLWPVLFVMVLIIAWAEVTVSGMPRVELVSVLHFLVGSFVGLVRELVHVLVMVLVQEVVLEMLLMLMLMLTLVMVLVLMLGVLLVLMPVPVLVLVLMLEVLLVPMPVPVLVLVLAQSPRPWPRRQMKQTEMEYEIMTAA